MHPYLNYLAAAAKHQDDLRRASQRQLAAGSKSSERRGRRWLVRAFRRQRRSPVIIDLTLTDLELAAERNDLSISASRPGVSEQESIGD